MSATPNLYYFPLILWQNTEIEKNKRRHHVSYWKHKVYGYKQKYKNKMIGENENKVGRQK